MGSLSGAVEGRHSERIRALLDAQYDACGRGEPISPGSGMTVTDAPVFILCCARSGSTLTRMLLNNHRDIACPPETHVPQTAMSLLQTWASAEGADSWQNVSAAARAQVTAAVSAPLAQFARTRGKPVWCDKSASNVPGADLLIDIFPGARFICLYRHPMDVIASGLAASKWGFSSYGFESYVQMSVDNIVRALAVYWYDQIAAIRRFERKHQDRCARIYYETLVTAPETTARLLCERLAIGWDPAILDPDFGSIEDFGAGDHKLPYTQGIVRDSIGRGRIVPVGMIPSELLLLVNAMLGELRYPEIGPDWNSARHPLSVPAPLGHEDGNSRDDAQAVAAVELLRRGTQRAGQGQAARLPLTRITLDDSASLVIDVPHGELRDEAPPDVPAVVVSASARALLSVAAGANMGEAIWDGEIRVHNPQGGLSSREHYLIARELMTLLRAGAA